MITHFRLLAVILLHFHLLVAGDFIRSEKESFKIEVLADGLQNPWGIAKLPDGRFLLTQREGTLHFLSEKGLDPTPITGFPPVFSQGQGGLLDVILHPDYSENGWIYLSFSDLYEGKSFTKIIRGKINDHQWTSTETIFEAPRSVYTHSNVHFGSRMVFDSQGFLYFSIGERGAMKEAQNLERAQGKIHRVCDDGKIPEDNPFVSQKNAVESIWAYGVRNPQGLFFDKEKGILWETEHGPKGGDELNIIRKGNNYGWPLVSYGINYNGQPISDKTEAPGITNPITYWVPSIAVSNVMKYEGNQFYQWKGNLFVVSLALQKFVRLEVDGEKVTHQEVIWEKQGRMRDIRTFDDGYIYILMNSPGKIIRLKPYTP
jgi:glucose/arabinose dehydrogenase